MRSKASIVPHLRSRDPNMPQGYNETADLPKKRVREGGARKVAKGKMNKGLKTKKASAARKPQASKKGKKGKGY